MPISSQRRGLFGSHYAEFMEQAGPKYFEALANGNAEGAFLDRRLANLEGDAELIEIGNPANPRLRREWERANGRPWPRTDTGRNYDVGHRKALADGGTNTLENIDPIHPDEHRARHKADGDYSRWGKRPSIARAFGGNVTRGLTPLDAVTIVTGILYGRIRTDGFDNFTSDLFGWPSKEDQLKAQQRIQRQLNPDWKPGDGWVV